MSIMKIGGKNDSNNVQGFSVNNKGYAKGTRFWATTITEIFNDTFTGTQTKSTVANVFNCEEYGFISLRFNNSTGVNLNCTLYSDIGTSTLSNWLKDNSGNYITFQIPTGQSIMTPDDLPILNYLKWLKFSITPTEAPAEGASGLSVQVYAKR